MSRITTVFLVVLVFSVYQGSSSLGESVIKSSNGVSNNVYKILSRGNGNVLFCPVSASIPLSLVYLAAKGKTADELRTGLQLGNNQENIKSGFQNLIKGLNDTKLKLATRLYPKTGLRLNSEFLTTAQRDFDSTIEELDYNDTVKAAKTINTFVEQKTNNKIHDLIDPNSIDGSTSLIIVNAAHFKDNWKYPFKGTFESDFYTSKNEKVKVQMMVETESYKFKNSESLNAKVLQLPFKDEHYSMVIVLPNEIDGLHDLETKLTSFDEVLSDLTYRQVHVQLPKFKIEATLDLKSVLQELGVKTVFTGQSDLSGLAEGQQLSVSDVIQKTFINVDENGVEAAAATAILVTRHSLLIILESQEFKANHPFIFAIMYDNIILFQGRLAKL